MARRRHRRNTLLVNTNGRPTWGASYLIQAYQPGAVVSGNPTGTDFIPLYTEQGPIASGSKVMFGLDPTTYTPVYASSVSGILISGTTTQTDGTLVFDLGSDTGTSSPNYDGSPVSVYDEMNELTGQSNASIISSSTGEYEYWTDEKQVWELIRTSTGSPTDIVTGFPEHRRSFWDVVEDFGADNTGTVDASTAIQAAIDACFDAGGGTVYIPPGTYKCNVVMRSNINFQGEWGASILKPFSDAPVIKFYGNEHKVRWRIADLRIDGTDTQSTFTSQDGIQVTAYDNLTDSAECANCVIERVRIKRAGRHGLYLKARGLETYIQLIQNMSIRNCQITNNAGNNLRVEGWTIEMHCDRCSFNGNDGTNAALKDDASIYFKMIEDNASVYRGTTRFKFTSCVLNGFGSANNSIPTVVLEGTTEIQFDNCDFEAADNYIQIGDNSTSTLKNNSVCWNTSFRSCRFGAAEAGATPDSYVFSLQSVRGFTVDGVQVAGAFTCTSILDYAGNTNEPAVVQFVDVRNNNIWGGGQTNFESNALHYVVGSANANGGSASSNNIRLYQRGGAIRINGQSDDWLANIYDTDGGTTNFQNGEEIMLVGFSNSASFDCSVTTSGNIALSAALGNCLLDNRNDTLLLRWNEADDHWVEVARTTDAA